MDGSAHRGGLLGWKGILLADGEPYWSTVAPHTFLLLLPQQGDVIALPLIEPDASHVLGLVAADREPVAPLIRELFAVANQIDLATQIDRQIALSFAAHSTTPKGIS